MECYHFNVLRDGKAWPESLGNPVPSLSTARVMAAQLIADMIRDAVDEAWHDSDWSVEVADDKGLLMFTFTLLTTTAPVLLDRA